MAGNKLSVRHMWRPSERPFLKCLGLALGLSGFSEAIILFGHDNDANLSAPMNGLPFDSVGQLGTGTGVYLGGRYVLTADHVSQFSTITFNGTDTFTHDGQTPVRIGNTDMKIFRLTDTPTVSAVNIYTGSAELLQGASLVGTGLGRDGTAVGATLVPWGADTRDKRWGTNNPAGLIGNFSYERGTTTYTYDAIQTILGSSTGTPPGTGSAEAGATVFDSGAPLFQNINGTWFLTGLTSVVTSRGGDNTSTFGNDIAATIVPGSPSGIFLATGSGDANIFVRVSPYAADIAQAIPEPSSMMVCLASLTLLLRRRR